MGFFGFVFMLAPATEYIAVSGSLGIKKKYYVENRKCALLLLQMAR